jgi:hypothetical protein
MGLLFIPQIIYEYGQPNQNDTDRGKLKNSAKTCPSVCPPQVPYKLTRVIAQASKVRGQ